MSNLKKKLIAQFGNPQGVLGNLVGLILAIKNDERSDFAVEELSPQPGDKILEIGFGSGVTINKIFNKCDDVFVGGIDISEVMVKQAIERNKEYIIDGKVRIQKGSVEKIPFGNDFFHKVLGINVSLFFPDPDKNFKEIKRVLKPGGVLQILFQPRMAKTKNEVIIKAGRLEKQVREAGFEEINVDIKEMKPVDCILLKCSKPVETITNFAFPMF